jgi:hypothetical protein
MQEKRRKENATPTSSMEESVLLHLFMESDVSAQVSKCLRCKEWTAKTARNYTHPLPSLLVVANNSVRNLHFEWGDETIWVGNVDYHLAAVSFVKPGYHYVLTCRFLISAHASCEVEEEETENAWFFYDDTVRGGDLTTNPNGCHLPVDYRRYHPRSWYYVTRVPEAKRVLSTKTTTDIRKGLAHITNYEIIRQESVTSLRQLSKRRRNDDGAQSSQQDHGNTKVPKAQHTNKRAFANSVKLKKGSVNAKGKASFHRRRPVRSGKNDRYK